MSTGTVLITGATGQVARALAEALAKAAQLRASGVVGGLADAGEWKPLLVGRRDFDLGTPATLNLKLTSLAGAAKARGEPVVAVINAGGFTAVDKAENEVELAMTVNGEAPGQMAQWCRDNQVAFVSYSTDYVYPGTGERPWSESDAPGPLSVYGQSKLLGDERVAETGGDYLIFRTSWVYDETGKNFVNTMLKLGAERETLNVVCDQWGAPTHARDIAEVTLKALIKATKMRQEGRAFPSGVYHLCGMGETHWHAFALAIFNEARAHQVPLKVKEVKAIPSSDYPTPAHRPANSRLSTDKLYEVFGLRLKAWPDTLKESMKLRYGN